MPTSIYHPSYQALRVGMTAARKAAGLTQIQMAQKLGVGQSYVSKIERGESYVDVMTFIEWSRACGLVPSESLSQIITTF